MAKTSLHTHTRLSRTYLALARLSCTVCYPATMFLLYTDASTSNICGQNPLPAEVGLSDTCSVSPIDRSNGVLLVRHCASPITRSRNASRRSLIHPAKVCGNLHAGG